MSADARTAKRIAQAAMRLAEDGEIYTQITHLQAAQAAGVSRSLVTHYFEDRELSAAILQAAIESDCLPVIAQALALGDPLTEAAPESLRTAAALHILTERGIL